ncbi:hypothetical protein HAX54_032180 [Datura stramonium]|uniref:SBP-type domain-containing protein n=1 Tax=Datura stramonium TaxID=4076 RepID=A0ABS8VAT5_DATST|nr:hypothetical protein [Datura stramonium]
MDWNLKSHLDWSWDNNISLSSFSGLEICRHSEPSIHEKEVNKAADHSRQIFSLNAWFLGRSMVQQIHAAKLKDVTLTLHQLKSSIGVIESMKPILKLQWSLWLGCSAAFANNVAVKFHDFSEFDDKKRCCRKLSDHNARRRRQPKANHFSSTA